VIVGILIFLSFVLTGHLLHCWLKNQDSAEKTGFSLLRWSQFYINPRMFQIEHEQSTNLSSKTFGEFLNLPDLNATEI